MIERENEEIQFTIGADPELFVMNQDGTPDTAIGRLGGTKDSPRLVNKGAVQEDNVLAEFNIDPANHPDIFVDNITTVMDELRGLLPTFTLGVVPSIDYDPMTLIKSGDQAMTFGCDPDFNAWTGGINEPPDAMNTLRTAGGHVHVGWDGINPENIQPFVKVLDFYLGLPSVLLDPDTSRRGMYGKAGAYRPKEYGVEYRTLSNFWIQDEIYMRWVYHNVRQSIIDFGRLDEMLAQYPGEVVQTTIDTSDVEKAREIVRALKIPMPNMG